MAHKDTQIAQAELMFGLNAEERCAHHNERVAHAQGAAEHIDTMLKPGQVALITGPSGSGKSLAARALRDILRQRGAPVTWISEPQENASTLACVIHAQTKNELDENTTRTDNDTTATLVQAMRTMARAGLAEAGLFGTQVRSLSDGQRARLSLAIAIARTSTGTSPETTTLIADKFCSTLDRTTAACVSASIARWLRVRKATRLVCISAHHDLRAMLKPDMCVTVPLKGKHLMTTRTPTHTAKHTDHA